MCDFGFRQLRMIASMRPRDGDSSMTIRFESDYHWRDEGWEATITLTDAFTPQAPVAVMAACANQMVLIPTCNADAGGTMPMQYKLNGNAWQDYTTTGEWVDLASQTFPLTVKTRTKIDDTNYSAENTFVFNKILPPGVAGGPVGLFSTVHDEDLNQLTVYFPEKPVGVNDTYYVRWTINNNSNDQTNDPTHYSGDENPLLWNTVDHEFREPSSNNSSVPTVKTVGTRCTSLRVPGWRFSRLIRAIPLLYT